LAGNKCDLINKEAVSELDAKQYAKEIGAIFQLTSAKENIGIDTLFKKIANKLLDPDFDIESNELKFDEINEKNFKRPNQASNRAIKIDKNEIKQKKPCIFKRLCKK